jgi:NAD(P)-dependent dehydrogenase (short-subunit alcohol dehydrogenase family)
MKDIAGKVAFVTGGASGIGLAMARSFSALGIKVAITDIEQAVGRSRDDREGIKAFLEKHKLEFRGE